MSLIGQFQRRASRNGVGQSMKLHIVIFLIMCVLVNIVSSANRLNNETFMTKQENNYREQNDEEDNIVYDWQLSTDNVDFYKILHKLPVEELIKFLKKAAQNDDLGDVVQTPARRKRSVIFGKDDRRLVTTSMDAEVMPYAASVRISTGCTGTLIGPKHVLTAAHCAYKGPSRRTKTKLKVGLLFSSGRVRWRKVRKVYAAREWHTISKHQDRLRYDYAVLELRRNHRRPYMTPMYYHSTQGSKLQFNGFPGDKKQNTMWHARCLILRQWHGYLINHCDVARGMSGSGSYLYVNRKHYRVRGLVIAAVSLRKGKKVYRFNVINPLTREKTKSICKWMKAGDDCKSFK